MNHKKAKITLSPEQETLLIPLYAKAQPGNPLFFDPKARDILDRVDYDFTRLHVPYKTVVLVCQRAKKLDMVARAFLAEHARRRRGVASGLRPGRPLLAGR